MEVYSAAYHGNVKSVKKLLAKLPNKAATTATLTWRHPHGGATALYVACEFGHAETAKVLLDAGAPPDQPRDDGVTPLYKACQDGGRLDLAKMLLKAGAAASYYRHEVSLTHKSRPWAHTAASCHFLKGRVAGEEC